MRRGDDGPRRARQRRQQLGRAGHGHEAVQVGFLAGVDQRRLSRRVDVRRQLAQHVGRAAAMARGDERLGIEAVALAEQAPVPLDDDARVDERSVHVGEHGRQPSGHPSCSAGAAGSAACETATVSPVSSSYDSITALVAPSIARNRARNSRSFSASRMIS